MFISSVPKAHCLLQPTLTTRVQLAPLYDSRGVIRYFIGAQVDVSGLAKQSYDLDALKRLVDDETRREDPGYESVAKDEFTQLAEIFESRELEIVRQRGGDMHCGRAQNETQPQREGTATRAGRETRSNSGAGHHAGNWVKPRVVLRDSESPTEENAPSNGHNPAQPSTAATLAARHNGRLTGVYEHYLLVRPYPSLRILFTSPSMRVPGILQSPLVDRIGGSARMRDDFVQALAQGQGVTAKVKWLNISHGQKDNSKTKGQRKRQQLPNGQHHHPLEAHLDLDDDIDDAEIESTGRSRWLHCTPLLGANGKVGVWMIVLVDDDSEMSLRGGGANAPSAPQQHLPSRPETAMSHHLRTHVPPSAAARGRANGNDERRPEPKHQQQQPPPPQEVRPRKSSETLSSPILSQFPEPSKNGSATSLIHNQHSVSGGQRAPRPLAPLLQQVPPPQQTHQQQFPKQMAPTPTAAATTTGLPANFFRLTALSRSSRNKLKHAGRGRGIGAFAAQRNSRQSDPVAATNGRDAAASRPTVEARDDYVPDAEYADTARHWPQSPSGQAQSGSRYVYIPPAIEEKSDRGSRLGDSLETASMQSLGSSYTVWIED